LILTNFGWYYYRDRAAMPGECITVRTANPQFQIQEETWKLLERALSEYGFIVDEEQHEKDVRARYSELLGGPVT
jgi:arginyl-tRNA--protein-N-Asp/Glu arginylyltransferase